MTRPTSHGITQLRKCDNCHAYRYCQLLGPLNNFLCGTCVRRAYASQATRLVAKSIPTFVLNQITQLNLDPEAMMKLLDAASRGSAVSRRRPEMFGEPH